MKNIKLYLLSGFLGAGKTTFLKSMLTAHPDMRVGIIMNEFGKISIDGPILDHPGMEMIELTRGSIFCSCLKLSFAESLIKMADKDIDYVVVESSGLADPSNIGEILEAVADYALVPYEYCGCINVVDAYHLLEQLETIETVKRQLETADLVLINKADRVAPEQYAQIAAKVAEINPTAPHIPSVHFQIDFGFMGEKFIKGDSIRNEASHNTPENKPKTFSMQFDEKSVSQAAFTDFLNSIAPSAYRVKGYVQLQEGDYQFDVVGNLIDYTESPNKFEQSTVVFISKIGPQLIKTVSDTWKAVFETIPMKLSN